METSKTSNRLSTKDLVQTALLVALVFIATKFINITLPVGASGGLVHLGNTMLLQLQLFLVRKKVQLQVQLVWGYSIYYPLGQYGHHLLL